MSAFKKRLEEYRTMGGELAAYAGLVAGIEYTAKSKLRSDAEKLELILTDIKEFYEVFPISG